MLIFILKPYKLSLEIIQRCSKIQQSIRMLYSNPYDSRFLFIIYIMIWNSLALNAQIKHRGIPDIKNFSRTQYNGGTQNWQMEQDASGMQYFANNEGLLTFDGVYWQLNRLKNNVGIRSLKIIGSKIFVGGYNEFGFFEREASGKLIYTSLTNLLSKESRPFVDFIWKIHASDNEIIFQSFEKTYHYDGKSLYQNEAPHRYQFSFSLKDRIIFQDIGDGLVEYKKKTYRVLPNTQLLNTTEVWSILTLDANRLLITTLDKGLFIYENNQLVSWKGEANEFLKRNSCLGGTLIGGNYIVLNSVLDGMLVCDRNGRIVQHINRKKGLQNNTVLTSYVDSGQNLWLGLDNGIAVVNESSALSYFGSSFDLSTVYASVVHEQMLYVATNQGLFYHSWSMPFKEDVFRLVEGTTGQAWNIQVIDNTLICSHNRGLMEISGARILKNIDATGYWGLKPVPSDPNKYIGSTYKGFSVVEKSAGGFKLLNSIEGFNKSSSTYELEQNVVWLKKDASLYKLKLSGDLRRFSSVKQYSRLSPAVPGIGSIQRLDGQLYFQQNNKFYTYQLAKDNFVANKKFSDLFKKHPPLRSLQQDKIGNIWYVFDESIGYLQKTSTSYINKLREVSNLTGYLVTDYVSVNALDPANILIGLTNGLAHFDSRPFPNLNKTPIAYINEFNFGTDTIFPKKSDRNRLDKALPYKSNNISFRFSAPLFEDLDHIEFSYRLEGFDTQWSPWSTVPMKEYTNLHEGSYTMQLKVRNAYGVQSASTEFAFEISPPWFRHWLAYVMYVALLFSTIVLIRRRTRNQIRRNKYYEKVEQRRVYLEKEAKIRQEQYELEKEIERLQNEKLKIKILSKDKELVNNSLQVVKKNKVLNGIIHKIKEIEVDNIDEEAKAKFGKLNKSIVKEVNADKSWKDLEKHIRNVHFDFLKRLKEKHPAITPRELDLSTYLLMNMSTKEIAEIMNISSGGVELARYRLRKKLNLAKKENLTGFLLGI